MSRKMLSIDKPKGKKKAQTLENKDFALDYLFPHDCQDDDEEPMDDEANSVAGPNQEQTSTAAAPPGNETPKSKIVGDKTPLSAMRCVFPFRKKVKKGHWSLGPRCQRNEEDIREANMADKVRLRTILNAAYLTKDQENWIIRLHVCISKYAHLSMEDYCGSPNLKRTLRCFFTNEMETAGALADLNGSQPSSRLLVWGPPGTGRMSCEPHSLPY